MFRTPRLDILWLVKRQRCQGSKNFAFRPITPEVGLNMLKSEHRA